MCDEGLPAVTVSTHNIVKAALQSISQGREHGGLMALIPRKVKMDVVGVIFDHLCGKRKLERFVGEVDPILVS